MIQFLCKSKKRLSSNRGELIVETIISFMVLSILVTAVFLVLNRAMSMTTASSRSARLSQEGEMNPAVLMAFPHSQTVDITIEIGGTPVATHSVFFNTSHGLAACFCANYPHCAGFPCPTCCGCNNAIAFSPVVP